MCINGLGGHIVAICNAPFKEFIAKYTVEDEGGQTTNLRDKLISSVTSTLGHIIGGFVLIVVAWFLFFLDIIVSRLLL